MATDLDKITQNFINEIGDIQLNEEQRRIYNAFVYRRRKPYKFSVTDKYDNTIRFILPTNNTREGVVHILIKHYNGMLGKVSANEILNFVDIIRNGNLTVGNNTMTYIHKSNGVNYSLIVGIKETPASNILKSFYSDKNKGSGTDCFANALAPIPKPKSTAKITKN